MSDHQLEVVTRDPYNAGTPLPVLQESITPVTLTYVRNHFSVPALEPDTWQLSLGGAVERPGKYSLQDIQGMPIKTLSLTLECAGNGRTSMNPQPKGTPWDYGALSVLEVTGTSLSNLLQRGKLQEDVVEISFKGADSGEVQPGRKVSYIRSLPLEVALHPNTMLVWAMNGEPLPRNHGFPLRLHVPGWYGMAAVKWLIEVEARTEPFEGFFQTEHYTYQAEQGTPEGEPVREMRVRSLVISPVDGATLSSGEVEIHGLAWSGKGAVSQVEVSTDGGHSWEMAEIIPAPSAHTPSHWRWNMEDVEPGSYSVLSRAMDSTGEMQPLAQRWNALGYGNNGVQLVEFNVE